MSNLRVVAVGKVSKGEIKVVSENYIQLMDNVEKARIDSMLGVYEPPNASNKDLFDEYIRAWNDIEALNSGRKLSR